MAAYNKAHPKSPPIGSVFAIQVNLPASLTKLWRRDKAYKLKVKAAPGTRSGYRWFDPRRLFPMQRTLGASNFVGIDVTGKGGDVKGRGVMGWVECAMCVAQDTARDMQVGEKRAQASSKRKRACAL